ncbi:MAG: four helix bundle protein [Syntrophomonadaceae bacterium]|nr:four helix bundle protein [Syntrophomonadaceae bacterium]
MRGHKNLEVWRESIKLVKQVYKITVGFPREELYALTSQMRRSAISIPSNIAEGAARNSKKEFIQFLAIARGSLSELETQLVIAKELGYIKDIEISEQIEKVFALLSGLIRQQKKINN